jgi:outer membrane receptor protein involved in Fe transport
VLATLTQNFKGIGEESTGGQVQNYNRGAEIQLRGLGPGTTLTLVNGQRQALGGRYGTVLDVSSIAASAVERIEILPEGASALYGSDAIGGVVNIILRKDFEGLETRGRVSTADGDANGALVAQLWGTAWSSGHVLVGYQYDERDPLNAADRAYSAANYDLRRFGGNDFRDSMGQYYSNPGTIMIGGQPYAIPHGQNGTNVTASQLVRGTANYTDNVTYNDVLPEQKMHSAFLNLSYDITDRWALSLDGRWGKRDNRFETAQAPSALVVPAINAFNRMGTPVTVRYDFTRDLGPLVQSGTTETYVGSIGLSGALPGLWQLKVASTYAEERNERYTGGYNNAAVTAALNRADPTTALNVFGDGSYTNPATLAALVRRDLDRGTWTTSSANALADGPLFDMPAGTLRLALGADYRKEELAFFQTTLGTVAADRDVSRNVSAAFAELAVPLIGSRESASRAGRLDLSIAGRYEDYNDFGTTFNPKVGLGWQPLSFVKLRGTWGTSFRAPPFWQSNPQFSRPSSFATSVADPRSPTNRSQVLVLAGPDPDLKEETADVWTAGIDFLPPALENLSLSFTFFDIDYDGKIQSAGNYTTFLTQEAQFAPVITRNPSQNQVAAICGSPSFVSGDCTVPIAAILDPRIRNLSKVRSRGLDADMNYSWGTSIGRWGVGLRGTYTLDYKTQLTDTAPTLEGVDTYGKPLALRLSGDISWSWSGLSVQTRVNHSGRYQDPSFAPARSIDPWTTVDLSLGYRTAEGHGLLDNTSFYVTGTNILDEEPPFVNQPIVYGYDSANASLLGRQISFQVVKGW